MAVRAAGRAAAVATLRLAVRAFLAPNFQFFFFSALDASLAHLSVVFNLSLRELAVLSEDDVEAEPKNAETYQYKCCNKNLHI